jgi:hypothetical protein
LLPKLSWQYLCLSLATLAARITWVRNLFLSPATLAAEIALARIYILVRQHFPPGSSWLKLMPESHNTSHQNWLRARNLCLSPTALAARIALVGNLFLSPATLGVRIALAKIYMFVRQHFPPRSSWPKPMPESHNTYCRNCLRARNLVPEPRSACHQNRLGKNLNLHEPRSSCLRNRFGKNLQYA